MTKYFELKEDHIKLLSRACINWQNCEAGAPEINPKRPYGNSDVEGDVAQILGFEICGAKDSDRAFDIHRETETALQVILSTKSFEPGTYMLTQEYPYKWERVAHHLSGDGEILLRQPAPVLLNLNLGRIEKQFLGFFEIVKMVRDKHGDEVAEKYFHEITKVFFEAAATRETRGLSKV